MAMVVEEDYDEEEIFVDEEVIMEDDSLEHGDLLDPASSLLQEFRALKAAKDLKQQAEEEIQVEGIMARTSYNSVSSIESGEYEYEEQVIENNNSPNMQESYLLRSARQKIASDGLVEEILKASQSFSSVQSVEYEDEYEEQVIEKWFGRDEEPDDLEAACRALIPIVYKGEDADPETMIRRTPLPELYKYLKQQIDYKDMKNEQDEVETELAKQRTSIKDLFKNRSAPAPSISPNNEDNGVEEEEEVVTEEVVVSEEEEENLYVDSLLQEFRSLKAAGEAPSKAPKKEDNDVEEEIIGDSESVSVEKDVVEEEEEVVEEEEEVVEEEIIEDSESVDVEKDVVEEEEEVVSEEVVVTGEDPDEEDEDHRVESLMQEFHLLRAAREKIASDALVEELRRASSQSFSSIQFVEYEDEYEDQVIEKWFGRDEEPDDLEAACRALIPIVYKGEDADPETMIRRTPLPELYKYLKQQIDYKDMKNELDEGGKEPVKKRTSIKDLFKNRSHTTEEEIVEEMSDGNESDSTEGKRGSEEITNVTFHDGPEIVFNTFGRMPFDNFLMGESQRTFEECSLDETLSSSKRRLDGVLLGDSQRTFEEIVDETEVDVEEMEEEIVHVEEMEEEIVHGDDPDETEVEETFGEEDDDIYEEEEMVVPASRRTSM
jgi:hypothetical protein